MYVSPLSLTHQTEKQTPVAAAEEIMAKSSQDLSSIRRHFHWRKKVESRDDDEVGFAPAPFTPCPDEKGKKKKEEERGGGVQVSVLLLGRRRLQAVAVARLRSVVAALSKNRLQHMSSGLGGRVVGTLFGSKRGHVHFAFQKDPSSPPAFLIELATPISGLVKEMASGLVRIALECDKRDEMMINGANEEKKSGGGGGSGSVRLLQEPMWRTYCNGKKCGFATRRECGEKDWKILKAVEPISMGAGVLPGNPEGENSEQPDEIMYMRAKFERIVGSRDSEAFYMMNPDSNGAPELSVYLLRV
uniref:Protein MIZU-KUSSEI 1 n=1 Tax=Kalanchoe fedtschenkoi TaxID=63787 RepID=A0A7N0V7Y3_KALFE